MKKNIIVVIAFFAISLTSCGDGASDPTTQKLLAYNYAEYYVKQRLKSPSSAKFPSVNERISHIVDLGNKKYSIKSWVESQNSFGALLKTNFSIKISLANDKVSASNLIID